MLENGERAQVSGGLVALPDRIWRVPLAWIQTSHILSGEDMRYALHNAPEERLLLRVDPRASSMEAIG